jgi:poly-gamma-glutamate capsule biosynthesis protein CapA/YwtB (metallophosphatase superfamily)
MLGRGVAEELSFRSAQSLFSEEVVAATREADLFVLNLECCISERGTRWPAPGKPFFFRAPPAAVETLVHLGVDCVTLANNHALDFGYDALLDTFDHLEAAGIKWAGAGRNLQEARRAQVLAAEDLPLTVIGVTDHPDDYAATQSRAGVAYADLRSGSPAWLTEEIEAEEGHVLVTPHWGPNMRAEPLPEIRKVARELVGAGATLVAGHSAHVFHGVQGPVLFDLGDFVDDYATDPFLRNDLGLLFIVTIDEQGPLQLEAIPLKLDYCYTRLAEGSDARWIEERFIQVCQELGTLPRVEDNRLHLGLR